MRYAILTNGKTEMFCGKLLRVTDTGMASVRAIDALDLLLPPGDGPCKNMIERPVGMLTTYTSRGAMLAAARAIYKEHTA